MKRLLSFLFALFMVVIFVACRSSQTVVAIKSTHDTIYVSQLHYDSVFIADGSTEHYSPSVLHYDSIIDSYLRVDTIFRDRQKLEYRYKLLRDTMFISKVDTIPKIVTVTRTQQVKYVPWYYKLFAIIGIISIVIVITVIAGITLKNKFSLVP